MADVKFTCKINDQDRVFYLKQEDIKIQRACDVEYHKAYVQCIKDGLLPRASLEQLMREKEVWTEWHEKKISELQDELSLLSDKLHDSKDVSVGLKLAERIALIRTNLILLYETRSSVFQSSCEFVADQVRREAYLANATIDENQESVFKSYQDFLQKRDTPVALAAMQALIQFISEAFQKTIDDLPENKFFNSYNASKVEIKDEKIKEEPKIEIKEIKKKRVKVKTD